MNRSLYAKFIITYVILAVLILTVVSTLGSYLLERKLIKKTSLNLYNEANAIASEEGVAKLAQGSESTIEKSLELTAAYQDSAIWIINTSGLIMLATDRNDLVSSKITIEKFDAAKFGPNYYEVSDFYEYYSPDTLHVMVPITSGIMTRGYVVIHKAMSDIFSTRNSLTQVLVILAGVFFLLSLLILLQFTLTVHRPLTKITEGALEYGSGNLRHRIKIDSSDEIGYLAESMNLMAEEIEKANDYQKQFVANVSHDFRSPLTSIKGFTEAMLDGTIPPEMHDKYIRIIGQEADRLESMTQSIMQMNTVDADSFVLRRTDFDINTVIKDTAALFEGSCRKKRLSINLVLTGEALYVNGDIEKIKQVLYNLLDNAIKFSDRNTSIKIETEERHDKCYISVKDSGCGISKADISQIWNRFYKSDFSRGRDKRGSGLGLSIVKEIIKAHGQNINVVSTEGVGTEFIFTLPLSEE